MERLEPQLAMKRTLKDLPPLQIPEGYALRTFQPTDAAAWEKIIGKSFETDFFIFDAFMKADPEFNPERIFFLCHEGIPVATASAWYNRIWGEKNGFLHMVGVLPSHAGRKLGYWVTLAALYRMVVEHRDEVVLNTDDFRIAAIKIYLKMGFQPLLCHETHAERWEAVMKAIEGVRA